MPTYPYACAGCGTSFEVRRSITEKPKPAVCPACRSRKTHQVLSGGRAMPRKRTGGGSGSSCSCGGGSCSCGSGGCGGCTKSSCAGCSH